VKIFADVNQDGELDATPVNTFNAYPSSFRGGVRVAAGNTDEPGLTDLDDELVTGPGPNGPGQPVKIWDDTDHDRAVSDNPLDDSFLPYEPGFGGGTYVAAGPVLFAGFGNLMAEVVVSAAGGQNRNVVVFTDQDGDGKVSDDPPFDQIPPPYGASFTSGVRVAAGPAKTDRDDVITAPGINSGSKPVKIYRDDGDPSDLVSDNPPGDQVIAFPGNFGEFVAFATTLSATYGDTDTPNTIPDQGSPGDPLHAQIQIPGSAGLIRDLDVSVDISHLFDAQLAVSLAHTTSGGNVVSLWSSTGHDDDGFLVWLDDEAAAPIQTVGDNQNNFPIAGVFKPVASLSAFDGTDASGTWTLTVDDNGAPGVIGILNSWSMKITY
jgi:subtilisin-like proprotein convertase family protein